jgi:hypothetical protein
LKKLTVQCEKHGETWALPVVDGKILPRDEWPADVEVRPRICAKCLVEHMYSPVCRAA